MIYSLLPSLTSICTARLARYRTRVHHARLLPPLTSTCVMPRRVSQAAAKQRRGRAGRVSPGVCYRICPQVERSNYLAHLSCESSRSNYSTTETTADDAQCAAGFPHIFTVTSTLPCGIRCHIPLAYAYDTEFRVCVIAPLPLPLSSQPMFNMLAPQSVPEIQRTALESLCLQVR